MKAALLWLVLFGVQDDLRTLFERLEKGLESGTPAATLLAEIDAYSAGKSPDVQVRLQWHRSFIPAMDRINRAYAEAMKKSLGAKVDIATRQSRVAGTLAEVREDRLVVTGAAGKVEIPFGKIRPGDRLAEARKSGGLKENMRDAALVKAADGDVAGALVLTIRIVDAGERSGALDALAALVLQSVDQLLAQNRLEPLAAMLKDLKERQPALMRAAGGAIPRFATEVAAPRLAEAGDEVMLRDKKVARRLFEASAALDPAPALRRSLTGRIWKLCPPGDWLTIPLDEGFSVRGGAVKDGAIVWDDPAQGTIEYTPLDFPDFPVAAAEISGARIHVRIDAQKTRAVVFWWYVDAERELGHGILMSPPQLATAYKKYMARGTKPEILGAAAYKKKNDYVMRFEADRGKLKLFLDDYEVYEVTESAGPLQSLQVALDEGRAEIRRLEVRKQ